MIRRSAHMYAGLKWSIVSVIIMLILIPLPKYELAFSKALYSKEGKLLSAIISSEQQWCFPMEEAVPDKLKTCIIAYEDAYFKYHPGINPASLFRAMTDIFIVGKPIRGASTITMQVMRMKNKHHKRSLINKCVEMLGAIKYTVLHSKASILSEWVEIAPFGGNTIGVKAASLRYFGRSVDNLSWGEYALLAVMPNSPSTANLTINRDKLKSKRDFLLAKLHKLGNFDFSELQLYLGEDIPTETKAIPQYAYHALMYLTNKHPDTYIFRSTMPYDIQIKVNDLLVKESSFLKMDDIRNISAVIIDVKTNKLVSYIGNVSAEKNKFSYVDIVQSARSYGSLLKPLLYAYAIENTYLLPNEMVADIPTSIGDFQPMNFDKKFRGAVPFEDMLIQSLNVPSVRVLNTVGLQGFYDLIRQLDIAHLNKGVDHYGLSIILGGGESSLWDLCRVYKGFAQNYQNIPDPFRQVQCMENESLQYEKQKFSFSGSTMDYLVKAMSDLTRPREEKSWDRFGADYKIAWKTGTSYGHKDAWALGFNGRYMVGVWVGNEGGEGRFDLTGITKAAPAMFRIFGTLPDNQWFDFPPNYAKKEIISICVESGKLAGPLCKYKSKITTDKTSYKYIGCNYHSEVSLNKAYQVISEECKEYEVKKDTVFMLPSYMEYYYKTAHNDYRGMPEFDPTCKPSTSNFKIIYPNDGLKIFLPKESFDKQNELIAKAYHNEPNTEIYWFIDEKYMLNTKNKVEHNGRFMLVPGRHKLTVTDQWGHKDEVNFEILGED